MAATACALLAVGVAEAGDRYLIVWRGAAASTPASGSAKPADDRLARLASRQRVTWRSTRPLSPRIDLVEMASTLTVSDLERLRADAEVLAVQREGRKRRHAVPDDPLFPNQWYLQSAQPAALDAMSAWDVSTGSPGTVVAVIDTGVRFEHPDLQSALSGGKLLPGYDFVSADSGGAFLTANDGDGRDADPTDPGDWVSDADKTIARFTDCDVENSSWHGTRVAGLVGALTGNATGIAGTNWRTWVLPVRVLGKCGGYDSDVIAGMRWAAGLAVAGVPNNPYPARVLNLSLGSESACTPAYQAVVDELAAAGVVVVASAGNRGSAVGEPASCRGAIGVAGLRHIGTKVGFSNLGQEITVSAPGGNCVNTAPGTPCLYSIGTTTITGATTPGVPTYTDQFNFNVGTSFSAPLVAASVALMQGVHGGLDPARLTARLRNTANPFPTATGDTPVCYVPAGQQDESQALECACTTETCGAGMLNTRAAVAAALQPAASIRVPGSAVAGTSVTLDAGSSQASCGRSLATFTWQVVEGSAALTATSGPTTSLVVPASGTTRIRLTVTDSSGATDTGEAVITAGSIGTDLPLLASRSACPATITPQQPTTPTPPPAGAPTGGSSGGGGALTPWQLAWLALLGAGAFVQRRRPRRRDTPVE